MSQILKNLQKEFFHYKALGDRTFEQLDTDQMNWKGSSESSSIGQIVKHLNGNMLSRWTDFLHSDGEKEWRERDDEFIDTLKTKKNILASWEAGWCCLFNAMDTLKDEGFKQGNLYSQYGSNGSRSIASSTGALCISCGTNSFYRKNNKKQRLELPFHPPWVVKKIQSRKVFQTQEKRSFLR